MENRTVPDADFVDRAIDLADLNALRLALYQLTGDPALANIPLVPVPVRGGAMTALRPAPEYHEIIKRTAREVLLSGEAVEAPPEQTTDDDLRELMVLMGGGQKLSDVEFVFHKEQYALHPFPRAAHWNRAEGAALVPEGFRVAIVGAGFSGVAAAVQLEQLGIPYTIFDREDAAGGTWYRNTFPDARVDTSSFIYQYSFEKRYPWTEFFAKQDDVRGYLVHVAEKFGVSQHMRFGKDVTDLQWDERSSVWRLRFADGSSEDAGAVIAASGLFANPRVPDIPGIEDFGGQLVHSLHWSRDIGVADQRIAIIGNGSTGVQIFPAAVRGGAEKVSVFQRTPQWISPLEGYRESIPEELRWLLGAMPYYWNWYCYSSVRASFAQQDAQVIDPAWQAQGGLISRRNDTQREILTNYILAQLSERPDLVEKVVPDYPPLARRLVIDNGWYQALLDPAAELVTERIEQLTPSGIRTADGIEREFDLIVLATGFETERYIWPMRVVGRDGISLEQVWEDGGDGARAYLGMTVPRFPNLFIMYGPNSQPRAGSLVCWYEVWSQHAAQAIVTLLEQGGSSIEVRQDVYDTYQRDLDDAHELLLWGNASPEGRNYYVNSKGRPQVNSPFRIEDYRAKFSRPFDEVYTVAGADGADRSSAGAGTAAG
jgi:4-hydroxyacetophenone monooxygenase